MNLIQQNDSLKVFMNQGIIKNIYDTFKENYRFQQSVILVSDQN